MQPMTIPGNECVVHIYHAPTPLRTVVHHIQPQEHGGSNAADNLVKVCDTGHYSIHRLLDLLLKTGELPRRMGSRQERRLARLGYDRIRQNQQGA